MKSSQIIQIYLTQSNIIPAVAQLKCRFRFPFKNSPYTKLQFEEVHCIGDIEKYRAKIITKQNDPGLNNNQQLQLQGWRANCDIQNCQVVSDHDACLEYLTKYATKGEPRSPVLKQAFKSPFPSSHVAGDWS